MEKFIPFKKLSKKKQREQTAQKRGTWGGLNPVTRKPENPKAYSRKKTRKWRDDAMTVSSAFVGLARKQCKTEYRGVAQLVARLLWECRADVQAGRDRNGESH